MTSSAIGRDHDDAGTDASAPLSPSKGVDRDGLGRDITRRRQILTEAMSDHGIEALVVATEANAFYLTGYETTFFGNKSKPFVVVFAPPHKPVVVCHAGEEPSVALDAIGVDVEPYLGPELLAVTGGVQSDYQLPAADAVGDLLRRLGVASIGIEASWHFMPGFTPMALDRLRDGFAGDVLDASPALWQARRVKSGWEIDQMRVAAQVAEVAHQSFAAGARVGMSERDLSRLLRRAAYDAGAERIGYSGIMAGVDRAPLGGPTDRPWDTGQLLFVDICLQLNGGYFADFSRIYANTTPTEPQEGGYRAVVDALDRARDVIKAGVEVRQVADAIIGEVPSIYARVGHGLGLEMPEPPSLLPQDETRLLPGEVVCIEPNREMPGVGWLVSEEEGVVRDGGFELLSPAFPPELRVIG